MGVYFAPYSCSYGVLLLLLSLVGWTLVTGAYTYTANPYPTGRVW